MGLRERGRDAAKVNRPGFKPMTAASRTIASIHGSRALPLCHCPVLKKPSMSQLMIGTSCVGGSALFLSSTVLSSWRKLQNFAWHPIKTTSNNKNCMTKNVSDFETLIQVISQAYL
ncbi:hypothetical protein XENORESO_010319 [Xenotaenia resolanae]|uniref:Uncharacterized protein n=1 Tax=Xenotaenia resolanae TaxID=208358 RepID=A0ABV0WYZ8_9TELE